MLEQLSHGPVNPQNIMGQLGNPLLGGVGSFGINPQLLSGLGGIGGINPTIGTFGTPSIDPVAAAYIQQQLAHQALLGSISPWGQVSPFGLGSVLGQSSPFSQASPYGQSSMFGQPTSPWSQILGQQSPFGQIFGQSPYGSPLGQVSPYSQIFGQHPSVFGQVSPYAQLSPYTQLSPFSQVQNPLLTHMQAAIAAQQLVPQLSQQQFGRVPYGISPFTQQLGPQLAGVTGWPTIGRGVSPFTQNVGLGTSPFQSLGG